MAELDKIYTFINIFYTCYPYPIHLYRDKLLVKEIPVAPFDFLSIHLNELRESTRNNISLLVTNDSLVYGMIREAKDERLTEIVVGPMSLTNLTPAVISGIRKTYQIPHDSREAINTYIQHVHGYTASSLANLLSLVNIFLNKENDEAFRYMHIDNMELKERLNAKLADEQLDAPSDPVSYQAAYMFEQELLDAVKQGDVEKVLYHRITPPNMHIGDFGDTVLRKSKNLYICSVAFTRAAAMEGGLDLETAYRLSDHYLQEGEKLTGVAQVSELNDTMLADYAEHCRNSRLSEDIPRDVFRCMQYVRQNLATPIKVADIAVYANMSQSQLNRKFKKSLNIMPSDFIMRCRLQQAKHLLEKTQKPIFDISDSLCFSSQSYFTNVFRKHFGITPLVYRQSRKITLDYTQKNY